MIENIPYTTNVDPPDTQPADLAIQPGYNK